MSQDYKGTITLASVSDGTPGGEGIGVVSIQEQYYLSTSPSEQIGGSWSSTYTWESGKYLWTRSQITWTEPNPTNPTYTTPVLASGINSANSTATTANNTANQTASDLSNYQTSTDQTLQNLQSQIDGQIDVWYQNVDPTTSNYPANQWTTPEEKARHLGDLYYNVSSDSGHSWRWMNSGTSASPVYVWQQIPDSDAAAALAKAQEAETLAGTKGRIFTSQPTPPYAVGDLWVDGNEVKYCTVAKAEGSSYVADDWSITATDDTTAAAALSAAQGAQSTADSITQTAITGVDVEYLKNTNAADPTQGIITNWQSTPPTWENGTYIWSRTTTTVNGSSTTSTPVNITGAKGETGAAAPYITLSGPTNVVTVNTNTNPTTISPSGNIDVIATSENVSSITWSYKVNGVTPSSTPSYISNITNGKRINATTFANTSGVNTLTITASGSNVSDTYTITRIENGKNGTNGNDAIEAILSNESHTLTANANGTVPSSSYTNAYTTIQVFEGITDKTSDYTIKVSNTSSGSITINGITVTVSNNSSPSIERKVSVTGVTNGFTNNVVPIDIYKNSTKIATKQFSISISKAGADGKDGDLYRVDTNYEDIYRTKRWNNQSTPPAEETSYSPTVLTFKVYKVDQTEPLVCNTDYKFDISILYNDPETSVDTNNIYTFIASLTGTNPFSLSADNKTISFNINNFMSLTSSNSTNQTRIEKIQTLVRTSDVYFILSVLDPSSTVGTPSTYKIFRKHVFSVINALTSSLASFSTTANSINMAVRDTKMDFTGDGLRITNGTFSVENNINHQVLSFNPNTGELYVEGTGIFTGDIYAENGTFGGTLNAARGTFKGNLDAVGGTFKGELTAASGTFKGELTAATGSFEGTITAKEGEIGGFKIGATSLYANKPSEATSSNSNLVLDSNTPSIKLGNLSLNGDTSTISGTSFSITPDLAEFKNINISGKISASVFEINKIQAVGGSMIFKPSFKVESFTNNTLTVSGSLSGVLSSSQYVLVVDENGDSIASHIQPDSVSGSTVLFNESLFTGKKPISLIVLGNDNDIIIGINSYNSNSLLLGQGLTIREYSHSDTTGNNNKPKLFLGNLAANNSIIGNGVSGYGLYADNVVLNGSLTTIITNTTSQTCTYAGVNTLSPVQATKFNNDSTNVVFWAGSAGTGAQEISEAPFQVTEKGSLYAAQGKFEGAIITRSEIQGVDIYGARIHGTGNNPGLGVYNTTNGITFYRGDYGAQGTEETFSIGSTGLQFNGSYFINVGGTGNIDFTGNEFHGNSFISTNSIQGVRLVASDVNGSNTITSSQITNSNNSYIEFGNAININVKGSQTSQLQLEQSRGIFNTEYLVTLKNLQVGNNGNSAMRFMQVSGGYDLYVA